MSKPIKIELSSKRYRVDPWSVFTEFRERGPIIPMKAFLIGNGWAVTTYEAVNRVLKSDDLFVRDPANAGRKTIGRIQWVLPKTLMTLANNMIAKDGVDHRRLRGLVDQAFARRNIEAMDSRLAELAADQVAQCKSIAATEGQVDLVEKFARPFPFVVICELLGIPVDDRPMIHQWFRPLSNFSGFFDIFRMMGGIKKMKTYLALKFEDARNSPNNGLISELVQIQDNGERLSEDELMAMVFLLFVAGHETTVHLISNCILTLSSVDGVKQELKDDWSKLTTAVEEVLRYDSPIQIAKPRYVARDSDFFGQQLKRGQLVLPLLASANYDPEKFSNPLNFELNRSPNYHMSFGSGPHTCLGIKLARSETFHALKALFQDWPDFRFVFEAGEVDWAKRPGMRRIRSLMVR